MEENMHNYPLKIKVNRSPSTGDMKVLDAKKQEVMFRNPVSDSEKEGKSPLVIYADKAKSKVLYHVIFDGTSEEVGFTIHTPEQVKLGAVKADGKGKWNILTEYDDVLAKVVEKSGWRRSCLFSMFEGEVIDSLTKLIAPHGYEVIIREQKVLTLREVASDLSDNYVLKKKGDFFEKEELLMVVGVLVLLSVSE
jgi:hypothetical protein